MKSKGWVSEFWSQCRRALWLLLVPLLASAMTGIAASPTEYELKLVYLYNFTKFVSWPDSAFESANSPINICVLGDIQETDLASHLNNRESRNRPITYQHLKTFSPTAKCHVLFVSRSIDAAHARNIISTLQATPVLLVGETDDFAKKQGAIGFIMDDRNRVRIEINLTHAQQRQLSIRAQLLEIARIVYRDEERS